MSDSKHRGRSDKDRVLFDSIAGDYARKDQFGPSKIARSARLERTFDAAPWNPHVDLLEIGCGAGFTARYLEGRYRSYTGIDHSGELIQHAAATNKLPSTEFYAADLYDWNAPRSYDVAMAIGVLHHLPDMSAAMEIIWSALNPGGFVVINEPHPANLFFHWLRSARTMVDASYSADQEELAEETLIEIFESAGFRDVSVLPQGVFSTPFAEVMLNPALLTHPLSALACKADEFLERSFPTVLKKISWNLIVKGQKPT